jgi:hypothetical protein
MVSKFQMINRFAIMLSLLLLVGGVSLAGGQEMRTAPPSPPQKAKPPKEKDKAGKAEKSKEVTASEDEDAQIKGEPVTVKLPRGGKIAISSRAGHIVVTGWDRDVVEATAIGTRGPAQVGTQTTGDPSKPRLLVTTSSREFGREVDIELKVPHYADVEMLAGSRGDVEISNLEGSVLVDPGEGDVHVTHAGSVKVSRRRGDIIAKEVKGDLTVRTFRGDIVANDVTGTVDIATTNGDLQIRNAGADVRSNSATGDIDVQCAKGRVDASSASGSITLVGVGGDVEASTASGSVTFTGPIKDGSYRMKTLSGEVTMNIQPDAPGFTANLTTYNGNIQTDFPLKVETPMQGPINRRIAGRYGDGRAKLSLDSFNGTVKVAKGNAAMLKTCK